MGMILRQLCTFAVFTVLAPFASAFLMIDDFTVGVYHTSITGTGDRDNVSQNLDSGHCLARERGTHWTVGFDPYGYTSFLDIGGHGAKVTTPGPNDLGTELLITYGRIHPFNLDLSQYTSPGTLFEIDLATSPPDLFAEVWSVTMIDGDARIVRNSQFGTRSGGIEFRRDGFVGDSDFDWSDIDYWQFRQNWNAVNTAPLSYWTTEIRAVPEPGTALTAVGALALLRSHRRRHGLSTSKRRP